MQALEGHNLSVVRHTKGKLPSLPFVRMRDRVLGKSYELSISFVNRETSRRLNREFRNKDYSTNILSFGLEKNSGELVISLEKVRSGAREHDKTYHEFLGFLIIHGMLHLKGMDHGSTMEMHEEKFAKEFGF